MWESITGNLECLIAHGNDFRELKKHFISIKTMRRRLVSVSNSWRSLVKHVNETVEARLVQLKIISPSVQILKLFFKLWVQYAVLYELKPTILFLSLYTSKFFFNWFPWKCFSYERYNKLIRHCDFSVTK